MDKHDLYKVRAEDFAKGHENLRTLEWQIVFQSYAGYAAIAVASTTLMPKYPTSLLVRLGTIIGTTLLFAINYYLLRRIHERLRYTRDMQNRYLDELHELLDAPKVNPPSDTPLPKHHYFYGLYPQILISFLWLVGISLFAILAPN